MSEDVRVEAAETQAAGSSFYAGMRVLPKAERSAMFAIYAFCRAVDDIADQEGLEIGRRRDALDGWRLDLDRLYRGENPGEAAFLSSPIAAFGLRLDDFAAVIDGMQMDVDQTICAPDLATLDLYCDRVASAVGRLSVKVFGMTDDTGLPLAHHLGRALQITNILRDVDEDAAIGRFYLAAEWLSGAGVSSRDPLAILADPRFDAVARPAAALARRHYAAADLLLRRKPRGRLIAPRLMSAVYAAILGKMEHEGWASPRHRVKISKQALMWILLTRGVLGL